MLFIIKCVSQINRPSVKSLYETLSYRKKRLHCCKGAECFRELCCLLVFCTLWALCVLLVRNWSVCWFLCSVSDDNKKHLSDCDSV